MAGGKDDLFEAFGVEDKLDGVNYPMWSFMIKHVFVAKKLWNIVNGNELCLSSQAAEGSKKIGRASCRERVCLDV